MLIEFHNGQLRVLDSPMHVDATEKRALSYVSHAHADHVAEHGAILATPPVCQQIAARWSTVTLQERAFFDPLRYGRYELELVPSGHALGASQLIVRGDAGVTVYTGDLGRPGMLTAEECATTPCDDLILDATYGRPERVYPSLPRARVALVQRVREALTQSDAVALFAHHGRAQEAIAALLAAGFPVAASESVMASCRVYQRYTTALDGVIPAAGVPQRGSVLVYPLRTAHRALPDRPTIHRIALSGMQRADAAAFLGVDEVVPLVDHADYDELVDFVHRCRPRRVHTVHRWAVELAQELRARGVNARPLDPPSQLALF